MHGFRIGIHQAFHMTEVLAGTALDHISGQCPRAAGETDQRHAAVQLTADGGHGTHDVIEITLDIRHAQRRDFLGSPHCLAEFRAFAGLEVKAQPHGIRDGQDVGEQDGGIQREALQRLQRHLAGTRGVHAQVHEATGLTADFAIFRQIAASLAHHPDGSTVDRLTGQRAQEAIILQGHRNHTSARGMSRHSIRA